MKKRILAILLVVAMVVSMMPAALAATPVDGNNDGVINYVSLGDSMTNGYGLYGYQPDDNPIANGYLQVAPASYPARFAAWLAGYDGEIAAGQSFYDGEDIDVNLTQLAMSGMRPEDALFALSYDWQNADHSFGVTEEEFAALGIGDYHTWDEFVDGKFEDNMSSWRIYSLSYYCTECEQTFKGTCKGNPYNDSTVTISDICEHVQGHPNAVADADVLAWHDVGSAGVEIQKGDSRVVEYKYIIPYNSAPVANMNGNVWFGNGTAATSAEYQNAIKNADIISICLGNANFGVVMLARLLSANGVLQGFGAGDYCAGENGAWTFDISNYDYREFKATITDPAISKIAATAEELFFGNFGFTGKETDEELANMTEAEQKNYATANLMLYTTVSYALSYRAMLDRIAELNPDAQIMIVGNMNAMSGTYMDMGDGEVLDLQVEMETIFGLLNDYLAGLATILNEVDPAHKGITYYYTEVPTVDVLVNHFADEINGDNVLRDRFVEEVTGRVFYMMGGAMPETMPGGITLMNSITREQVEAYLDGTLDELLAAPLEATLEAQVANMGVTVDLTVSAEGLIAGDPDAASEIGANTVAAVIEKTGKTEEQLNELLGGASAKDYIANQIPSEYYASIAFSIGTYLAFEKAIIDGSKDGILYKSAIDETANGFGGVFGPIADALANDLVDGAVVAKQVAADVTEFAGTQEGQTAISAVFANAAGELDPAKEADQITAAQIAFAQVKCSETIPANTEAALVAYGKERYAPAQILANIKGTLYDAMMESDNLVFPTLLSMFGRMIVGTGVGQHPSAEGHDTLTTAVVAAYEDGYTANEKTDENLQGFEDAPVVKEIAFDLANQGLLTDDQAVDIALIAYEAYKDDESLDGDLFNVIDKIYTVLFVLDPDMTDEDRLAIITIVYNDLKDFGYLESYEELAVVEDLVALEAFDYVTDEQAFEIVEYVYADMMADGEVDMVATAKYLYTELLAEANVEAAKKVEVIKGVYEVLKANHYLDGYAKELAVVEDLVALEAFDYVTDEQAFEIVEYVYADMMADGEVDMVATAKYLYIELLAEANVEAAKKVEVIKGVYEVLKAHGYLDGYAKELAVVEGIVAIPELEKVTASQTFDIVKCVYDAVIDDGEVDNNEMREIALCIYFTIFKAPVARTFALRSSEFDFALTPADKIAIIEAVYEVLEENDYLDAYPELDAIEELYNELDEHVSDEKTLEIFDIVFLGLLENEEVTEDVMAEIVDAVYGAIIDDPEISDDAKGQIIDKVYEILENNDFGGSTGIPTIPEGPVKDIYDYLNENKYLTAEQKVALVDLVYTNLMNNGDLGEDDMIALGQQVFGIMNSNPNLTVGDKLDIAAYIFTVAEEYGYFEYEAGVIPMAYKMAYQYAAEAGYVDAAAKYLESALGVVAYAYQAVEAFQVTEELANTKALLLEELDNAGTTISTLVDLFADDQLTAEEWAIILDYQSELDKHINTITKLGAEMGVLGNLSIDRFVGAYEYVEKLVNDIAANAYAWAIASDADFKAEYDEIVADVVAEVNKINPALGTVVGEYLTETPVEAMKIIYAAGEEAYEKFINDAAIASGEIETIINGLVAVLQSDIDAIVAAIDANGKIETLKGEIETMKAEIRNLKTVDAEQLNTQLAIKQAELVEEIVRTIEAVAPGVGALVSDAMDALGEAVDVVIKNGSVYDDYIVNRFDQMSGDLLDLIIANTEKYGFIAGTIVDEMIWTFINETKEDIEDEIGLENIDLSEVKAAIAELKAIAAKTRNEIAVLKNYTSDKLDTEIIVLENALAAVEAYADKLQKFVDDIEALVATVDGELSIENVQAIVAQAKVLAADAETLVNEAKASIEILVAIYEEVMPQIVELLAYVEEGSPADAVIDTANDKIGSFIAVTEFGYNTTVAELEIAAANIETVVTETLTLVCDTVAVAVEDIADATEIAADDIIAAAEDAIEVAKAEAIALANSTDAEIAAAGKEILALIENLDLAIANVDFETEFAKAKAITAGVIVALENVSSAEDAKAVLAQATEALDALAAIADDIYAIAERDVITVLGNAETLAQGAKVIAEGIAGTIGANAVGAYEASAEAVVNAAGIAIEAVDTALVAYENAVVTAANVIIPAVTEAVESITAEVTGVAETSIAAVETSIECAKESEAIIDALEYAVYDATHGEVVSGSDGNLNYAPVGNADYTEALRDALEEAGVTEITKTEVKDADLITVKFDNGEFMTFAYEQVMGMVADVINDSVIPQMMTNKYYGEAISSILAEYEIDLTKTYNADALEWSKFDASVLEAREEILVIVEEILKEQSVPEEFTYDLGPMVMEILNEGIENEEDWVFKNVVIELDIPVFELLMTAADNALYGYFEYAAEFPVTLNTIRETAPNAHIVVTGVSNNVADVLPAFITDNFDISEYNEYIDYVVDALNMHLFAYAAVNTNTTYVESGDVADILDALTVIRVKNYTGNPDAETYSLGKGVINVRNDLACVVLIAHADGTYTRLAATANPKGGYDYDISGIQSGEYVVIAVKGDYDLDGQITMVDATSTMNAWVNATEVDGLLEHVVDVNNNNAIDMGDATMIMNAWVNATGFAW